MMDRNLRYIANLSMLVMPHLVARQGAAVFVSSISGMTSAPQHSAYGAAKAGVINFTRSLAVEYGKRGVRVNSVAPGFIATEAVQARHQAKQPGAFDVVPLRRAGEPDEIAGAVAFLVSPWSSYVTGQTLLVDGGASITFPFGS
jgi:NAD(P)-dependent dehydrogenase (short-subunit alcohol dehydrogenase family)